MGFDVIGSTIFVQKLVISKVDHFCVDIVFDEFVEVGEGSCSHSVGAVDGPGYFFFPAEVVCWFDEVVAESFPEFGPHFLCIFDLPLESYVGEINFVVKEVP